MTDAEAPKDVRLDLALRSYTAFAASDPDALALLYTEDCVWDMGEMGAAFGMAAYTGHDGLAALLADIGAGARRLGTAHR